MSSYYANITLSGAPQDEIVRMLRDAGVDAYVSGTVRGSTVIFHEDLGSQEALAARLSSELACPALLCMAFGGTILLYHLYESGAQTDAYVSSPHNELETSGEPAPTGDADVLCRAFNRESRVAPVARILNRLTDPTSGFAQAMNRHGELARALGLPLFAAGVGFRSIELGEVPGGEGFDLAQLIKVEAPQAETRHFVPDEWRLARRLGTDL